MQNYTTKINGLEMEYIGLHCMTYFSPLSLSIPPPPHAHTQLLMLTAQNWLKLIRLLPHFDFVGNYRDCLNHCILLSFRALLLNRLHFFYTKEDSWIQCFNIEKQ